MTRRWVRFALLALFLLVLAGAGVTLFQGDQRATAARTSARQFDRVSQRIQASVDEARLGMQAALVNGQGAEYWMPKAQQALEAARSGLTDLKQRTSDGAVLNDLDAAAAALDEAAEAHANEGRLLRNELRTQAAAIVFGDGIEALATMADRVEGARLGELSRADSEAAAVRAVELLAAGAVAALSLVVVGLLLPAGSTTREAEQTKAVDEMPSLTESARPARTAERAAPVTAAAATAPLAVSASATPQATEPAAVTDAALRPDRRRAPELRAAADLCTDFARLVDAHEMPALLDRAARLLDASGVIVWVAEPGADTLKPLLAHGYPAQALARLPAIPRQADNATAAAYRHAEMQIVRTNGMSPGAIVVPILTPAGCVGAMAAEVRLGREASESVRALARIVAAQLSTLLSSAAAETPVAQAPASEAAGATRVG